MHWLPSSILLPPYTLSLIRFCLFTIGSHSAAQDGLELTIYPRLILNSWQSFCLCLLSASCSVLYGLPWQCLWVWYYKSFTEQTWWTLAVCWALGCTVGWWTTPGSIGNNRKAHLPSREAAVSTIKSKKCFHTHLYDKRENIFKCVQETED